MPPGTPAGLTATPGDGRVDLAWTANREPDLRGYHVYWRQADETLEQSAFVAAPTTATTVTDLENGQPYRFAIEAENDAGVRSQRSADVLAVPFAAGIEAPTVIATVPADGAVDVPWNAAVVLTFSLPMDEAATEAAWGAEPDIACGFTWNATRTVLSCLPTTDLAPNGAYGITLDTGAKSSAGVPLAAPHAFSFTTGAAFAPICRFDDPTTTFGACVLAP